MGCGTTATSSALKVATRAERVRTRGKIAGRCTEIRKAIFCGSILAPVVRAMDDSPKVRKVMLEPGRALALASVLLLLSGAAACDDGGTRTGVGQSPPARAFDATVASAWFDELYRVVKRTGTAPPGAARLYGYAGVALYESVVPGMPGSRTLAGQLQGLAELPQPGDALHHWPIVANAALGRIATSLYPGESASLQAFEDALSAQFDADVRPSVRERSLAHGRALGAAISTWAEADGIAALADCSAAFTPPVAPSSGGWTPTGAGPVKGLEPCWGSLRPLALSDAGDCPAAGPPAYSADPDSAFYAHALAVYATTGNLGAALDSEQEHIARYWADDAARTGTPPGHWMALVGGLVSRDRLGLDVAAEVYARVGIAVADAFIVCWNTKYDAYLLRPVSYIQSFIDPSWQPLLGTPPFPSYTSGHSTQSGAAAAVLTAYFGPVAFVDTTHQRLNPELALGSRSFRNFFHAAGEAAVSRLYGGIHYAFDNQDGFDQGLCIGTVQSARLRFTE